jgi:structural protein KPP10_ORF10
MATYSFLDVVANISGPTGNANLAKDAGASDEGISFEATGDKNTMQIGGGGAVQHSLHADKSGRVIVRLLKTSPINALLHQMYDVQTTSASLHGQNIIVCQQKASGDITTARQVAFKRKPPLTYQKEAGTIEWEFDAGQIDTVLGTYPTS